MTEQTYTPQEVAELFGVSDETVYRWIRSGAIAVEARGIIKKHYRIPAREIERIAGWGYRRTDQGNELGLLAHA